MAGVYAQFGAGFSVGEGWINYDNSPTYRIQRVPLLGKRLARWSGLPEPFPKGITHGDVVRGLPLAAGSVDGLYASHVLEHLSLSDMRAALAESMRVLKPGGVFRLIVPDLRARMQRYLDAEGDPEAAHLFMRITDLGHETRGRSLLGRLRALFGNSAHLWMYDYPAMKRELERAGFTAIRRAEFGDADDTMFARVEERHQFHHRDGYTEVALECRRPLRPCEKGGPSRRRPLAFEPGGTSRAG